MAISSDEFKQALQLWASGVAVVTTQSDANGIQGMTVTAFSSVSLNPPQILVCLNQSADTGEGIRACGRFAVNVLTSEQEHVSNQFAGGSSQQQRFEDTPWQASTSGMPLLSESLLSLDCRVIDRIQSGTHDIIIGEVEHSVRRNGMPLLYFRSGYRQLKQT